MSEPSANRGRLKAAVHMQSGDLNSEWMHKVIKKKKMQKRSANGRSEKCLKMFCCDWKSSQKRAAAHPYK